VRRAIIGLAIWGCGDNAAARDVPGAFDAAADAGYVDPLGPWGAPRAVFPPGAADDDDPTLTADLLELYWNRNGDIYVATRPSTAAPWSAPAVVAELSGPAFETTPEVSGDGLTMYFASDRPGGLGNTDLWISERPARGAAWGAPNPVPALSSYTVDGAGGFTADGLLIVIGSERKANTDYDLYESTRPDRASAWSAPVELAVLDSSANDWSPHLTPDALTLYYVSYRSTVGDLYVAHRPAIGQSFGPPRRIDELASEASDSDPWISPDGHHLVFASDRDSIGLQAIYEATR
jgi:hypothetical protein